MQDAKRSIVREYQKMFNLKKFICRMKSLFALWIVIAIIVSMLTVGYNCFKMIFTGKISSTVNFSFDGIELGLDPNGNKFDVSEIKSVEIIKSAVEDLGYEDLDPETVQKSISIESVVPNSVIDDIVSYSPLIDNKELSFEKRIQDTSYYPTQYKIEIKCESIGISKKEAANLLNKITEKYNTYFYKTYGYNASLESSIISIDYNDYDYIDAVNAVKVSLKSLQKYINELAEKDTNRFRSQKGYTFADISASIDTVCNENLDQLLSYVLQYNVSRDKKILTAKYKYNIEEMTREKEAAEEAIEMINKTISEYEKNSILIMGSSKDGVNSSINKTSDSYEYLIEQRLNQQTILSRNEEDINLYNSRIKSLAESGNASGNAEDVKNVEEQFDRVTAKVDELLNITNETASEYYEKDLLNNAYTVLYPADSSLIVVIKSVASNSVRSIISYELILLSLYIGISALSCFVPIFTGKKQNKKEGKKKKK